LNSLNFNSSIKEQFNNFISQETPWRNIFTNKQLVNIDFWCYNKDTKLQLYCGIISAFHIDNNRNIIDLSKKGNTWSKVEKGNRLYFLTSKSLSSLILNEQESFQNTISKTIEKTLDLSFKDQKELLSNSLELIESGSEQPFNISIAGYLF